MEVHHLTLVQLICGFYAAANRATKHASRSAATAESVDAAESLPAAKGESGGAVRPAITLANVKVGFTVTGGFVNTVPAENS